MEVTFFHTTVKPVPQTVEAQQLLTLMAVKNDRAFPCIWVLMDSTSEDCYKAIIQYLKQESVGLEIRKAITTSDEALEKCLRDEFPAAEIHRSLFFQYEDLYNKLEELNLQNYVLEENNDDIRKQIHSLMSLALLPADLIEEAFQDLKGTMNPESWEIVQNLYNYYETHWMRIVGPNKFSVYGKIECVSDVTETYNNLLQTKVGTNPTIWKFTKCLVTLQRRVWHDYRRTVEGYRGGIQSPAIRKKGKDCRIQRAWSGLEAARGRLTPEEFLEQASYICVVPVLDHIIIYCQGDVNQVDINENQLNNFDEEADFQPEDINPMHFLQEFKDEEVEPEVMLDHENANLELIDPEEPSMEEPVPDGDDHECCICRMNQPTHAFIPCGHQVICSVCVDIYQTREEKKCPMCRAESTMAVRIYR